MSPCRFSVALINDADWEISSTMVWDRANDSESAASVSTLAAVACTQEQERAVKGEWGRESATTAVQGNQRKRSKAPVVAAHIPHSCR